MGNPTGGELSSRCMTVGHSLGLVMRRPADLVAGDLGRDTEHVETNWVVVADVRHLHRHADHAFADRAESLTVTDPTGSRELLSRSAAIGHA